MLYLLERDDDVFIITEPGCELRFDNRVSSQGGFQFSSQIVFMRKGAREMNQNFFKHQIKLGWKIPTKITACANHSRVTRIR